MDLQAFTKSDSLSLEGLMENKPDLFEPFKSWEELKPTFSLHTTGDCLLIRAHIEDGDFEKLLGIFQSKEEAMGAFLTLAMEYGWEEVPKGYCVYHAQEEGGRLIAGIKLGDKVQLYEQTNLEEMVQAMVRVSRIVVYSSEVLTYIKDIYPEVDSKAYVIAREIAKRVGRAPEIEELAKIYGLSVQRLEEKLELIDKLLENPIRLPWGEVELPHYSLPLGACQ
ncbi:MAG: hypothetical protein D6674_01620 [Acidobacteria bacterium]|jgi:hypothetical protein|nr:MAG: hypothetical protein D6674_01620 [Acidobacteriota bacterium]